jgi:mannose-binding lectin 1
MKIPASIFLFSAVAAAQRVIETSSLGHGAMYLPTFLTSLHALLGTDFRLRVAPSREGIPGWDLGGEGHFPQIVCA